jgi:hypothetical protein
MPDTIIPIASLENPAKSIIPHPCSQAAEDRNTDAIRRILVQHFNEIKSLGTRLAHAFISKSDEDPCVQDKENITGFQLWGEDEELEIPTFVNNFHRMGLKNGVKVTLAYSPKHNFVSNWKIIEADHVYMSVVEDLEYSDGALTLTTRDISAPSCDITASAIVFTTETTTVLRLLDQDGCSLKSKSTEIEVFAKTESNDYVTELTFSSVVDVLGDVYQKADGNIYGYYTPITVPCVGVSYEELLIYTDDCQP